MNSKIFKNLNSSHNKKLATFINLIFKYNQAFNIISRKIQKIDLVKLIEETILLTDLIETKWVIDAGSGNGILGIPLAILNENREFALVERKKKKWDFLLNVKEEMCLGNIFIFNLNIQEYLENLRTEDATLIARGFPDCLLLIDFLKQGIVRQLIIITGRNKIKNFNKDIENTAKNIYNIPWRDNLIIMKLENVSRETYNK